MESHLQQRDGVTVLRVVGDIDVSQVLALRDVLGEVLVGPAPRLVIDLGVVAFVDSAGVGLLVTAHRKAAQESGEVLLADVQPDVARILELTRTDRLLTVVRDVEAGVVALRAASP